MKKIKILLFVFLVFGLVYVSKVGSVGVSSEYYDGNPLPMYAGETKYIQLELQNMVGNEDIYLKAVVLQGNEFATITDENPVYLVPFGRKDIKVNLKINVPQNTQPNIYKVIVSFVSVTPGETTGTVRLGVGIDKIVPIRVNAPPQVTGEATKLQVVSNLLILFVVVILIVLAAILVWISKKKKNR